MCERFKLCETINNNFDWVRGLDNCVHTTKVIVLLVQISAISGWNAGLHLRCSTNDISFMVRNEAKRKKGKRNASDLLDGRKYENKTWIFLVLTFAKSACITRKYFSLLKVCKLSISDTTSKPVVTRYNAAKALSNLFVSGVFF